MSVPHAIGMNGTARPDVIGIAVNGANKVVEVVSPYETIISQVLKVNNMVSSNPGSVGQVIKWPGIVGKVIVCFKKLLK